VRRVGTALPLASNFPEQRDFLGEQSVNVKEWMVFQCYSKLEGGEYGTTDR
jgi:hypothetical protein